jgi:hypothetical protein
LPNLQHLRVCLASLSLSLSLSLSRARGCIMDYRTAHNCVGEVSERVHVHEYEAVDIVCARV